MNNPGNSLLSFGGAIGKLPTISVHSPEAVHKTQKRISQS